MCVRVFSVGFGPGLDSMSPARSRRSASHAAGTHGWLPQKTGRRGGVGGYNLHSVPPNSPPDCGTPTTSRLYPFGACCCCRPTYHHHRFSDRAGLPPHNAPFPGMLMKSIGAAFYDRMPFLTSTTCVESTIILCLQIYIVINIYVNGRNTIMI